MIFCSTNPIIVYHRVDHDKLTAFWRKIHEIELNPSEIFGNFVLLV